MQNVGFLAWTQITDALNMSVTGVTAKLICAFVFDVLHICKMLVFL